MTARPLPRRCRQPPIAFVAAAAEAVFDILLLPLQPRLPIPSANSHDSLQSVPSGGHRESITAPAAVVVVSGTGASAGGTGGMSLRSARRVALKMFIRVSWTTEGVTVKSDTPEELTLGMVPTKCTWPQCSGNAHWQTVHNKALLTTATNVVIIELYFTATL